MFLTNVFFIPFMALRAKPEPLEEQQQSAAATGGGGGSSSSVVLHQRKVAVPGSQQVPGWAPAIGAVGAFLGEWRRRVVGVGGVGLQRCASHEDVCCTHSDTLQVR